MWIGTKYTIGEGVVPEVTGHVKVMLKVVRTKFIALLSFNMH